MSKAHILENGTVVLHTPIITGSNTHSKTWKNIYKAVGRNVTKLDVGTLPGQITQIEKDSILAGDTMEFSGVILTESGKSLDSEFKKACDAIINTEKSKFQKLYKRYGHIIA